MGHIADMWGKNCIKPDKYAISTNLMSLESGEGNLFSDDANGQKEGDISSYKYIIIASAIGILTLTSVVFIVVYMRNRDQKQQDQIQTQASPSKASHEASPSKSVVSKTNEIFNQQSISETPFKDQTNSEDIEIVKIGEEGIKVEDVKVDIE